MAKARQYFEARRYSAVTIDDSRFNSLDDLLRFMPATASRRADVEHAGWRIRRVSVRSSKRHYPENINVISRGEGHPVEVYLAVPVSGPTRIVVAAPYVTLLRELMVGINSRIEDDRTLHYLRPKMTELFAHFESNSSVELRASLIEVKMKDHGLEYVSLAGTNPLRSELRAVLSSVSSPYAIRVRSKFVDELRPTSVNFDKHGNLHFYLSAETAWLNVSKALTQLLAEELTSYQTGDLPLDKLTADETEAADQ